MPEPGRRSERGVSLVALMVGVACMAIAMAVMMPAWSYVAQNEREEELLFRGEQIARAIEAYKRKNGNALPTSLEMLVKGRYLRQLYKDPMARDGKWRLMHPGEPPLPLEDLAAAGQKPPQAPVTFGQIDGVAPRCVDRGLCPKQSLRFFNGQRRYSMWVFRAGGPRIIGKLQGPPGVGGAGRTPTPQP